MSNLTNNTTELQAVLEILQDKATGAVLPELSNEGTAADLTIGKQLIDSQGNIVTGTNPYEQAAMNEAVAEQSDVIDEIENVVDSLPEAGGGGGSIETVVGTISASGPAIEGIPLSGTVYFLNENGKYCTANTMGTISVMKDSILFALNGDGITTSGDIETLGSGLSTSGKGFHVTGNFTILI